jgi:FlaA1/EpsC-like NDP-sugar epimerase
MKWLHSRADLASKVAGDALLLCLAFAGSFLIRFDGRVPTQMWAVCYWALPWIVLLKLVTYHFAGLYRSFWRYSGVNDLQRLVAAQLAGLGTSLFIVTMSREATYGFPRGIYLIDAFLSLILTGSVRFGPRWLRETVPSSWMSPFRRMFPGWTSVPSPDAKRVLVVGAGDAGEVIVSELMKAHGTYLTVGIIDDDPAKRGRFIHGVPVVGGKKDLPRLADELRAEEIILTGSSGEEVRSILRSCRGMKARIRTMPSVAEIVAGAARATDLRDLKVEDLLRREEAKLDLGQISGYLRGKRILVTGAGGSIGSELCRQIARFGPAEILLFGRGENSIFCIEQELKTTFPKVPSRAVIGDVINKKKLQGVFRAHQPEIVFHAGADKHVPLMEANPDEAVLNNIFGTRNLLEVCEAFGVDRIVCVSTDKAVNPTSVMGACKRVAEMIVQGREWKTPSIVVRFGNVLGSRGSVVPIFFEQIRRGGPVTVTHPEMTRFFMTIPEAAGLVIQAGAFGKGGDVFVLDMGEQVRIADLAREMIQLAGLTPGTDVPIEFVGMRPGEKLYEELAESQENLRPTSHPKILRVAENGGAPADLDAQLKELFTVALEMDNDRMRATLAQIIPTYRPSGKGRAAERPSDEAREKTRVSVPHVVAV